MRRSRNSPRTWASGYDHDRGVSRVLYVIACGSPAARDVHILVGLAQRLGWEVCVVATPDGRRFVDGSALALSIGRYTWSRVEYGRAW